ncbi:MAG: hypothetical protein A3I44_00630 [Candidatus Sungbacteria bacterium RIFCSPLOWO2_02_FULL_51_17]|uniref:ATPase AAA-type core domain-containing protein n=1 Tax=Candidatus Sungbacteria bacterium RIFCSPHIGHO2_02_FULL_51_29 TaxID=1802273 RepID=A0A1G2KZP9_9BACT|nr:MAG: hypothetical protein A2676_01670 [Candidatus Sungbacteria bacterium RIFCSPHIGHO2_01_FULL_51_22]OHA03909.1 MAG: hypothetical protein A3C16_03795 [Candidatus Sungbacteria bacterium RIFCSPHIGHO2_02_FULL_51_29]OHA06794.1 MAG: hypothetical protein A3B29_01910 [Candidatus Sungbacteria bacterium RIFCSPLOWO2_01_FULL_51_34]OHA10634.1 MAG: hypothetical protein A3I44_00630 [Candidatus Sungbacteria bacterium RIFCSPLOWO2_02_FULL_51_17]
MRPKKIPILLKSFLRLPEAPTIFIWGPPGIGKSDIIKQVAAEEGINFIDMRLATRDPSDIKGIPVPRDERTKWFPPEELPKDGRGILFLDELNLAPPLVQASAYQLILNKRVEQYRLPAGWMIITAGNRSDHAAHVYRMAAPLRNRFVHIDFEINVDDWREWAMKNDLAPEVIEFISFRPDLLFKFDPKRDEYAFPTPRSWHFVSRIMKSSLYPSEKDIAEEAIRGAVGAGAAAELRAYIMLKNELPYIDDILEGRSEVVPARPDIACAVVTALSVRAEPRHFNTLLKYSNRLPAEAAVLLAKLLIAKNPEALRQAPLFPAWSRKYANQILT